jgi:phosphatidylglycerophosphatase A
MLSLFFLSTTVFFRSILHEFEVIDFWIEIGKFFLVVAAIFSVHSLLLYLARIDLDLKSFSVGRFGEQLLSFFEAGYFPVSQGSYASFFSYFLIYYSGISRIVSFVIFVLLFFAGLFFACKFEKELSEYDLPSSDLNMRVVSPFSFLKNFFHFSMELGHDSRIIVVDEVAAVFLIFSVFELGSFWISLLPLLIFRFFDITKIFGISFLEKRMRGGFAVMFDDLLAAVYSIFLFAIIKHIFL